MKRDRRRRRARPDSPWMACGALVVPLCQIPDHDPVLEEMLALLGDQAIEAVLRLADARRLAIESACRN
ncbi:MAG TPA: hypothetical protein VMJ65_14720 [Solirubrobacteraceae bacterium]|nr:hypothetical protein [Solirubrobacteraceae bacterium]